MKKGEIDLGLSGYEALFMTAQERTDKNNPRKQALLFSGIALIID